MRNRRLPVFLLGAGSACLLAGCALMERGDAFQPSENTALVGADGSLEWASVEELEGGDYSQEEMADFAREKIGEYNASAGASNQAESQGEESLPVSFVSAEIEEGRAVLITAYNSPSRLVEFAEYIGDYTVPFTEFSVLPAKEAGEELSGVSLENAEGKSGEALSGGGWLIRVQGQGVIHTEDKVSLISAGCSLQDAHTVLTSQEGVSYIITE